MYNELRASLDRWFQICMINNISSAKMARFFVHRYFYPHIFSLEKKEVVLYGAGTIGQDYYAQLSQYQKCRVVAWVDKNALKYKNEYVDTLLLQE